MTVCMHRNRGTAKTQGKRKGKSRAAKTQATTNAKPEAKAAAHHGPEIIRQLCHVEWPDFWAQKTKKGRKKVQSHAAPG